MGGVHQSRDGLHSNNNEQKKISRNSRMSTYYYLFIRVNPRVNLVIVEINQHHRVNELGSKNGNSHYVGRKLITMMIFFASLEAV